MLETTEQNLIQLQNRLAELSGKVYRCKNLNGKMKQFIVEKINEELNRVDQSELSLTNCIEIIENKIGTENAVLNKKISYLGETELEDFMATGKLIEVSNSTHQGGVYFYFDTDNIDKFYKLNDKVQEKFNRLVRSGDVRFAAAQNEQGIKHLGSKENLPTCQLQINQEYHQGQISYELKVIGTEDRIGIVAIKPEAGGPEILVATHAIKGGFHSNKHNNKQLKSNEFTVPRKNTAEVAKLGFFAPKNLRELKDVSEKSQSKRASIKAH